MSNSQRPSAIHFELLDSNFVLVVNVGVYQASYYIPRKGNNSWLRSVPFRFSFFLLFSVFCVVLFGILYNLTLVRRRQYDPSLDSRAPLRIERSPLCSPPNTELHHPRTRRQEYRCDGSPRDTQVLMALVGKDADIVAVLVNFFASFVIATVTIVEAMRRQRNPMDEIPQLPKLRNREP